MIFPPIHAILPLFLRHTMPDTIKEFFTDSEWDLIYSLVSNNRDFCEDEEEDPVEDYDNIISKIYNLHKDA
jgi:hypothetical protein